MSMKRNSFLICILAVLLLFSCGGRGKTASALPDGDTIPLRYAENLTLVSYPDYTLATLRNPWDTLHTLHTYILVPKDRELPAHLPEGTVVRTPLSKSVIYSSVHCGLMDNLGVFSSIGGVCDLKYIKLPAVHEACRRGIIVDCGDGMNPDMERIIDLHPDAILLSPFENSGGYGRIEKLDIPIIECADYMETSALGRAEWMRFYGRLVGRGEQADSLFRIVEREYQRLSTLAKGDKERRSVLPERKTGSTWYLPGGRSSMGLIYRDAHISYAYASDTHSGSLPLSFETVLDKAGEADIWLMSFQGHLTKSLLLAEYAGYEQLRAFKEGRIYGCPVDRKPYFEEVSWRPDWLLRDLIVLFHPALRDRLGSDLRYYQPIV